MDGQKLERRVQVEGSKLTVTLNKLSPGVTYNFSVNAKNSKGIGPPLRIDDYQLPGGTLLSICAFIQGGSHTKLTFPRF